MKNLTKSLFGAASLMGVFAATGAAYADDAAAAAPPAPMFAVSAAVAVQSDYRFRGISQNGRDIAPQATINVTGPDGWYVGAWTSKVDWFLNSVSNNPSIEIDEYGGKHTDLWGTDLNVEAYYYSYPDARTPYIGGIHTPKASYFEAITQLSHTFGPLALVATWAYSPEFTLGGGTGNYLEGTGTFTINDWLTASANVGHQWVQTAKFNASKDYTHYDFGVTATYKALSLDLRYVDTDLNKTQCAFYMATKDACAGGFMGTLTYNISAFPW
jgi:uncharacterized protein (TIGR02001 family)